MEHDSVYAQRQGEKWKSEAETGKIIVCLPSHFRDGDLQSVIPPPPDTGAT